MKKILARQLILKNIHAMALKKFIQGISVKKFLQLENLMVISCIHSQTCVHTIYEIVLKDVLEKQSSD